MASALPIEFTTGTVDAGWSDFTIRLGKEQWTCQASYVDAHPVSGLLFAAVDLYDHIFRYRIPVKNAIWRVSASDEPGGIVLQIVPVSTQVRVSIFLHHELMPDPAKLPSVKPSGQMLVDYWEFAEAVYRDVARAVVRQGFTGFRQAWEPCKWDVDHHFQVLPIEHFLFLACLVQERQPCYGLSFGDELRLLRRMQEDFG